MVASRLAHLTTLTSLAAWSLLGGERDHSALRGKIEDQFSEPVPKAIVTLVSLGRVVQRNVAPDGSFVFSDIPDDAYEIEIVAPGFTKQKLAIDLRTEATIPPLEIALHVGSIPDTETCGPHSVVTYGPVVESSHRLTGLVHTYDHNKPMANANVTLRPTSGDDTMFRASSDKDGKYVFENLPAARYELQISRRGYASQNVELVVPRSNEVFVHTMILGQDKLVVCQ